jgi:hypothetical protein
MKAVADQQRVNAGVVEDARERRVVGGLSMVIGARVVFIAAKSVMPTFFG